MPTTLPGVPLPILARVPGLYSYFLQPSICPLFLPDSVVAWHVQYAIPAGVTTHRGHLCV